MFWVKSFFSQWSLQSTVVRSGAHAIGDICFCFHAVVTCGMKAKKRRFFVCFSLVAYETCALVAVFACVVYQPAAFLLYSTAYGSPSERHRFVPQSVVTCGFSKPYATVFSRFLVQWALKARFFHGNVFRIFAVWFGLRLTT